MVWEFCKKKKKWFGSKLIGPSLMQQRKRYSPMTFGSEIYSLDWFQFFFWKVRSYILFLKQDLMACLVGWKINFMENIFQKVEEIELLCCLVGWKIFSMEFDFPKRKENKFFGWDRYFVFQRDGEESIRPWTILLSSKLINYTCIYSQTINY